MKTRPAFTAREARTCCTCEHYHPLAGRDAGECRHPQRRWGIEYENTKTGRRTYVEWWTVGCYATCHQYSEKL